MIHRMIKMNGGMNGGERLAGAQQGERMLKHKEGKGWQPGETCSERVVPCFASRGMLWYAWSQWCWEDFFYQYGQLM